MGHVEIRGSSLQPAAMDRRVGLARPRGRPRNASVRILTSHGPAAEFPRWSSQFRLRHHHLVASLLALV